MYRCLRDKTVWKRKTDDARDEARATEEKEVPVKACGLLERVLTRLRGEGRHIL